MRPLLRAAAGLALFATSIAIVIWGIMEGYHSILAFAILGATARFAYDRYREKKRAREIGGEDV